MLPWEPIRQTAQSTFPLCSSSPFSSGPSAPHPHFLCWITKEDKHIHLPKKVRNCGFPNVESICAEIWVRHFKEPPPPKKNLIWDIFLFSVLLVARQGQLPVQLTYHCTNSSKYIHCLNRWEDSALTTVVSSPGPNISGLSYDASIMFWNLPVLSSYPQILFWQGIFQ